MRRLILPMLFLLPSCAQTIDAPSLLPRASELSTPPATAAALPPCTDTGAAARIVELRVRARTLVTRFDAAIARARTSAPRESDAWVDAQNARSEATLARGEIVDVQTILDDAARSQQAPGCVPETYDALRAEIQATVDAQQRRLDALGG